MSALLRLLLLVLTVATLAADDRWICGGKLAHRTYRECQSLGNSGEGCYYLQHFGQYRPCALICNDVIDNSIDHERCLNLCPDYLRDNCRLKLTQTNTTMQRQTTTSTSISTTSISTTSYMHINSEMNENEEVENSLLILVGCGIAVLILATVLVLILMVRSKHKQRNTEQQGGKQMYYEYEYVKPEIMDNSVNESKPKYYP